MFKKGEVESGMIIVAFVMMGLFVLGAMATQTSTIFSSFNTTDWGVIGFTVRYFNIILFVALSLTLFVGFGAFKS